MSAFLDKLSIRGLLKFTAVLTVFLQVFNNVFIYFVVDESLESVDYVKERVMEVETFDNVTAEFNHISNDMRSALLLYNENEKKLLIETIRQKIKNILVDVEEGVMPYLSSEDATTLRQEVDDYIGIADYVMAQTLRGEEQKARTTLLNDEAELLKTIEVHFAKVGEVLLAKQHRSFEDIERILHIGNFVVLGLLILAALISVVMYNIASTMGKRFLNNINELVSASENLDLTARLHAKGENELALLSENFNQFSESMHKAMKVAVGSSHAVSSASQQLSSSLEQLRLALGQQGAQVSEITDAMNQASETVLDVTQRVQGVENNIVNISGRVEATATNMDKLKEESTAISTIVGTIQDISEQVNLLALNAAIEAARAGDAGRGFAVVADEVRKLASKTNNSTGEISEAITSLQGQVEEAHGALGEMTTSVSKISEEVQSVAAASTEQSSTIEQISATITSFAEMISQNEGATQQASDATNSLKQEAENLDAEIKKFIL